MVEIRNNAAAEKNDIVGDRSMKAKQNVIILIELATEMSMLPEFLHGYNAVARRVFSSSFTLNDPMIPRTFCIGLADHTFFFSLRI